MDLRKAKTMILIGWQTDQWQSATKLSHRCCQVRGIFLHPFLHPTTMAKAKKPRNFKFTVTQSKMLEEYLATYRKTIRNNPDNAAHTLTTFFNHIFTKLEEAFTISESAPREKVIVVSSYFIYIMVHLTESIRPLQHGSKSRRNVSKRKRRSIFTFVRLPVSSSTRRCGWTLSVPLSLKNSVRKTPITRTGLWRWRRLRCRCGVSLLIDRGLGIQRRHWKLIRESLLWRQRRSGFTSPLVSVCSIWRPMNGSRYGGKHFRRSLQGTVNDAAKVFNIVCTVRKRAGKKCPFVSM